MENFGPIRPVNDLPFLTVQCLLPPIAQEHILTLHVLLHRLVVVADPGCVRVLLVARCGRIGEVIHLSFSEGDADAPTLRSCNDAGFAVVCTPVEVVHFIARVALC